MLMVGKCGKMPMVWRIIPTNQKTAFRGLPVMGVMPLVAIKKLPRKKQAAILNVNLDFIVKPVFPSPEFQNFKIRNDGRLLKRMKNLHDGFPKCDGPSLLRPV